MTVRGEATETWGYVGHMAVDRVRLIGQVDEQIPYPIVFMGITGSHMWSLATPDSDLDVRGVYVKPTEKILSIHKGRDNIETPHADINQQTEGIKREVDVQFYEIEKACGMLLNYNGNLVELALSPSVFYTTQAGLEFKEIARGFLTKRLRDYYRGYATSQRKRAAQNRGGKALVYTYREIFAGIWLMRTGEIEYDFRVLWANVERESIYRSNLLPRVFDRPKWQIVTPDEMLEFEREWNELCVLLAATADFSSLPDEYDGYAPLNDLLLRIRRGVTA